MLLAVSHDWRCHETACCVHTACFLGSKGATSSQPGMQDQCRFYKGVTRCRHRHSAAHIRQCHIAPNLVQKDRLYEGRCETMPRKSCSPCMASEMSFATTLQAIAGTAYVCFLQSAFTDHMRNVYNSVLFTAPKLAQSLLQDWDSNHMLLLAHGFLGGFQQWPFVLGFSRDLPKRHSRCRWLIASQLTKQHAKSMGNDVCRWRTCSGLFLSLKVPEASSLVHSRLVKVR
jgi:hypothetical protein